MSPSLGLITVAQTIREGNEIEFINENIGDKIKFNEEVDVVGITVTVDTLPRAIKIAEGFRKEGVPVIAGGIQITSCPESAKGHFDALCIGFAEKTWPDIIADVSTGNLKLQYFNFIYRKYGKITARVCDMIGYNRIGYVCEKFSFL